MTYGKWNRIPGWCGNRAIREFRAGPADPSRRVSATSYWLRRSGTCGPARKRKWVLARYALRHHDGDPLCRACRPLTTFQWHGAE